MTLDFSNYLTFFLVMLRMTGVIVFNPILGRTNVPPTVRVGMAFLISILVVGMVPPPDIPDPTLLMFLYYVLKELLVGLVAGIVFRTFMTVMLVAGDMIDMQVGISMAKAFDPGTNASVALTAQYLNLMFFLTFFVTNGHLTLIQMTVQSFQVLPLGTYLINMDALNVIPLLLSNVLLLGVKMSLPVLVIEIISTFAVGMIMRIIPQINVFVINIQIKLIVGIFLLVMLAPSFAGFVENLFWISVENIQSIWVSMAAS